MILDIKTFEEFLRIQKAHQFIRTTGKNSFFSLSLYFQNSYGVICFFHEVTSYQVSFLPRYLTSKTSHKISPPNIIYVDTLSLTRR